MSNFLVRAWRARLPWEFWLFAFTTFTEARFFHDFYAEKELEGSLFLMPIWRLFFWIKRWIVKICPKYTRYLLFLSGLQRFLWRLWKRKEYNPLLRARERTWKPWCFDELSQNVNCFKCAFPGLFYKAPKFVLKLPTFWKKTPTFFQKSPTFWSRVKTGSKRQSLTICENRSLARTRARAHWNFRLFTFTTFTRTMIFAEKSPENAPKREVGT